MSKTAWAIGIVVFVLIILFVVGASLFAPFGYRGGFGGMMGRGGMMGGFGSPFMFMGGLGMLVFWVLLIGGIVWFVQSLGRGQGTSRPDVPAAESLLDILKRRYAKGEISKEQFEEMKRDLGV